MRVHLKTLGCHLNEAELETWSRDFQAQGHQITQDLSDADLVVVNTRAVTGEAVRKSRKLMHKVHRENPHAKLVVSSCYTSLNPVTDTQIEGVDLVEITNHQSDLHSMPAIATIPEENSLLSRGRQRAFCIVTVARGEERSRPIPDVVDEVNRLPTRGIQEVVLAGVHIGGYGSDTGSNLYELVKAILADTDIPLLRPGAVEPWDIPGQFWSLFDNTRFIPHLHLPLQSGADTVLRRMARRCKTDDFEGLVTEVRQQIPDFNLTTDIIVGFPGETEDEWNRPLKFVERISFGHLHIFSYSSRPDTRAAVLPDALPRELIRTRSEQMHQLGNRLKSQTQESYTGRHFPVLTEGADSSDKQRWSGYTPNFLCIELTEIGEPGLKNSIRMLRMKGISESGDALIAELE